MKEFVFGAAGIIVAGAAIAQTQPAPTPQPVPQVAPMAAVPPVVDRITTRDEAVAKVREHFAKLDTNRDGFLTKQEADAAREAMKTKFAERWGGKGIGHTMNVKRDPAAAFDRLDTNKDGAISRDEFAKGHDKRIERRVIREGGPGAAPHPGMPHEGMRMHRFGMMGGHLFEMSDANKDGRVSLQEATDAAARHFDMADANRDGRITPDERRQMRRQFIEKRRAPKAG